MDVDTSSCQFMQLKSIMIDIYILIYAKMIIKPSNLRKLECELYQKLGQIDQG